MIEKISSLILTKPLGDSRENVDIIIGVDLDQTIADCDAGWRRRYQEKCVAEKPHRMVSDNEISLEWSHFEKICAPCFAECLVDPYVVENLDPLMDGINTIKRIYHSGVHGYTVGFHAVTARPHEVAEPSVSWFEKVGIASYFRAVTFTEQKREALEQIGAIAHIDDSYGIYRQLTEPFPSIVEPIFLITSMTEHLSMIPKGSSDWKHVEQRIYDIILKHKIKHKKI